MNRYSYVIYTPTGMKIQTAMLDAVLCRTATLQNCTGHALFNKQASLFFFSTITAHCDALVSSNVLSLNKTGHRNQLFQLASKSGIVDVKLILVLKCCFIRSTFSTRFHIPTYLYGRSVPYIR